MITEFNDRMKAACPAHQSLKKRLTHFVSGGRGYYLLSVIGADKIEAAFRTVPYIEM